MPSTGHSSAADSSDGFMQQEHNGFAKAAQDCLLQGRTHCWLGEFLQASPETGVLFQLQTVERLQAFPGTG